MRTPLSVGSSGYMSVCLNSGLHGLWQCDTHFIGPELCPSSGEQGNVDQDCWHQAHYGHYQVAQAAIVVDEI